MRDLELDYISRTRVSPQSPKCLVYMILSSFYVYTKIVLSEI